MMASFVFFGRHVVGVLPPFVYERLHIGRERGVELDMFSCTGVDESQGLGVEGLPWQQLEAVGYELAVFGVDGPFAYLRPVIPFIVEERVPDPVEVYPDLVRPSCLEPAFHHCDIAETLQHPEMGDGSLSPVSFRKDPEPHPVGWVAAYIAFDGAFVFPDVAPDDGYVSPVYRMDEELSGQVELRLLVFGYYKKSGCVLVDPVHEDSHSFIIGIRPLADAQVMGQGVDKRPGEMAVTGMDDHSGRLVDDKHIVIFIDYVQGNVLWKYLQPASLVRHHECDDIPGPDNAVGFGHLVVDPDITITYGALDAVS